MATCGVHTTGLAVGTSAWAGGPSRMTAALTPTHHAADNENLPLSFAPQVKAGLARLKTVVNRDLLFPSRCHCILD